MTDDIVKRLHSALGPNQKLMREAADEIETLRKRLVMVVEKLADIDATCERMVAMVDKIKTLHDGGLSNDGR